MPNELLPQLHWMLLRAWMDAKRIPYMTVGDSNIENIQEYLCENKIMPAHLVPQYLRDKYKLVDNSPSLEEEEKKTKDLQRQANEARLRTNNDPSTKDA